MDIAFLGRVSTEDAQDPEASRMWQLKRARDLVEPLGHRIVAEFFDVGQSRSLPWKRRPHAAALLEEVAHADRRFDGVVIGEPQRAFYGHQFAMTFPILTHYRCALFVPEVGGQVDPDSEAHEIMMGLFGGMSKGERSRIKKRTATSMQELAAHTDRHLGGRPPYGYQSVDVGPHPNPAKAAAGQRAHKLALNPETAPIIQRIFAEFLAGRGIRAIADRLARSGVPSPSAQDPGRNRHRDQRGWAHSTVRAILMNPTYTGYRVWGKQEKFERLMNVDDVAAGEVTRMRWRQDDQWIRPKQPTHPAIIDVEMFEKVRERIGSPAGRSSHRSPKAVRSGRIYPLASRCFCVHCDGRLSARFYQSKKRDGTGRVLYRCEVGSKRSLPSGLVDHPVSSLNQGLLLPLLDDYLVGLFDDPMAMAIAMTGVATQPDAAVVSLNLRIASLNKEVANLVGVLAAGTVSEAVTQALAVKEAELRKAKDRLADFGPSPSPVDPTTLVDGLRTIGGALEVLHRATDAERRDLYEALALRIDFDSRAREIVVTIDPRLGRDDNGQVPLRTLLL